MSKVPDRTKLRREYLRKKISNLTGMGVSGCAYLASLVAFLGCTVLTGILLSLPLGATPETRAAGWTEVKIGLVTMLLSGASAVAFRRITARFRHNVRHLTFVAPVTPNTFPADEILVRGSEELATQSEVLLRAAQQQAIPAEDLLRVSQE